MSTAVAEARVGAVIDLRAYAVGAAPSNDWVGGRAAPAFADEAANVSALAPRGNGRVESPTCDEFVIVIAGRLEIEGGGRRLVLEADQSAVLPVGVSFDWRAADDTLAIVYSAPAAEPGTLRTPAPIDTTAKLSPSNPPLAELLVGPTPSCRNHSDYWSATREFVCGTWDSTPYHRRQMPYRQVELMLLLDGSVTFADETGRVTHSKGDLFVAIRGPGCSWISEVYVKKVYATQRAVT